MYDLYNIMGNYVKMWHHSIASATNNWGQSWYLRTRVNRKRRIFKSSQSDLLRAADNNAQRHTMTYDKSSTCTCVTYMYVQRCTALRWRAPLHVFVTVSTESTTVHYVQRCCYKNKRTVVCHCLFKHRFVDGRLAWCSGHVWSIQDDSQRFQTFHLSRD